MSNTAANTISAYSVNASTGALAAVTGSPFASGGTGPVSVDADPSGSFLVTANNGSSSVSVLRINGASGALAAVAGSPFATGSGPESVVTVAGNSPFDYFRSTAQQAEVDDVSAGLNHLKSQPFVDPARIAISGCSYGGIQTLLGGSTPCA